MNTLLASYINELANHSEQLGIVKTMLERNWSKDVRTILERELQAYKKSVSSIKRMIDMLIC